MKVGLPVATEAEGNRSQLSRVRAVAGRAGRLRDGRRGRPWTVSGFICDVGAPRWAGGILGYQSLKPGPLCCGEASLCRDGRINRSGVSGPAGCSGGRSVSSGEGFSVGVRVFR